MEFTPLQIRIIKLLKTYQATSLASIATKLEVAKSSLLYQIEPLVERKILIKNAKSTKTITYTLAAEADIRQLIAQEKSEMELLLTNTEVKGIAAYKELLTLVANGDSDIIGYANLERKLIPELISFIERFRDKIAKSGRKDRFTITDYPHNLTLLEDHLRKSQWKETFLGKIISHDVFHANCDIYVWDGTVGICSFEDGGFKVTISNDKATFDLFHDLLWFLWEHASQPNSIPQQSIANPTTAKIA